MENKTLIFVTVIMVFVAICVVIFIPKSNGENAKLFEVVNNTPNINNTINNYTEESYSSTLSGGNVEDNIKNNYTVENDNNSASCCSTDVYSSSSSSCCGSVTSSISSCCQ